jgi:hypothetical protein
LRLRDVEDGVELIPGCFGIGKMRAPGDLCLISGEFPYDPAVSIQAVDAETRRLSLDGAGRVFEAVWGKRHCAG